MLQDRGMKKRTRVAVYGSYLPMMSIAASLKAEPKLEVVPIGPGSLQQRQDADQNEIPSEVEAHALRIEQEQPSGHPDVIIFDIQAMQPALRQLLAGERPDTLLIGLDVSSNELLVLRGYTAQALSVADLVNLILQRDSRSASRKETRG